MPRLPSDRVPKYGKHKQSGQARVVLSGRHYVLGAHGTKASKLEYDRRIAEWVANGRRLSDPAGEMTVSTLILRFWEHASTYYRNPDGTPGPELENFQYALALLRRLYGATRVGDFGPLALKAVRQVMIADRKWCRNTANRQTNRIRQVFKWAAENELVPPGVCHGLRAVAGLRLGRSDARESEPVKPVPEQHVYAIKDHVSSRVWAMIELQLLSGMRPGEVAALRTGALDTTGALWMYKPAHHKTSFRGHERTIYLGPKAQDVLAPFLKPDLRAFVFSPADAERERRDKLNATRTTPPTAGNRIGSNRAKRPRKSPGQRYTVRSYHRAIIDACDDAFPPPAELARQRGTSLGRATTRLETRAGWRARLGNGKWEQLVRWRQEHRWHPHQLRHTAGTRLRKQYGLEAAQVILGHRSLAVTEIYAEKNVAAAMKIMGEVG